MIKLIVRILLSPIVFALALATMTMGIGPLMLIIGIVDAIGKWLSTKKDPDPWNTPIEWDMIFCWIVFPVAATYMFIKYGDITTD